MNHLQQLLNAFLGLPVGPVKMRAQPVPLRADWSALERPAYLRRQRRVSTSHR